MSLILSGTDGLSDVDGTAATPAIRGTDANTGIFFPAADTIAFSEGGAEAMRIDSSGNLGIGTASPLGKVHASSASSGATLSANGNQLVAENSGNAGLTIATGAASLGSIFFADSGDSADGFIQYDQSGRSMRFGTATAEKARIDSSGNLGLGVTPSASQGRIQINGAGNSWFKFYDSTAGYNFGTFYKANGTTALAYLGGGTSAIVGGTVDDFVIRAEGNLLFATGGGTEKMRLDSSGNVGIGTSSPAGKLSVNVDASTEMITFRSSSGRQIFAHEPGGNARPLTIKAQTLTYADDSSTRLVVDSSGNVGIGTSSPSTFGKVAVEVAGTTTPTSLTTVGPSSINLYAATNGVSTNGTTGIFGWTATTGIGSGIGFSRENSADWGTQIRFYTHPTATSNIGDITERMRIDSSGNLLVGVTSGTSYKLSLKTSLASQSAIGTAGTSGDTAFQSILVTKFDNDSTTSQNFIQFQINNGGANCGKITANGANTAAFGSTSDQRVKENIAELPSQLANIMALRPVEFDYLESYGGGHQIGFIAQEIQQVYPDVISTDDSSEKIMSITGWSKTEARLVKAIQEQQALITQLTARITALEGA